MIPGVYLIICAGAAAVAVSDLRQLSVQGRRTDVAVYAVMTVIAGAALVCLYFAPRDFSLIQMARRLTGIGF